MCVSAWVRACVRACVSVSVCERHLGLTKEEARPLFFWQERRKKGRSHEGFAGNFVLLRGREKLTHAHARM